MMTPINVSSFFYDPLKLEDQKAVTLVKSIVPKARYAMSVGHCLLQPGVWGLL